MIKSDNFPVSHTQSFFKYLDQFAGKIPSFGNYSDQVHKIDNVEDYLNFSWKFDTSCLSNFEDKFSWIDNISDVFSVDFDDKLSSHYDSTLLGLSTLESKLKNYLYGNSDSDNENTDYSSWNLPDSHPLKVTMVLPGVEDFDFNTNWYERLQSGFRNLWLYNKNDKLSEFNNDYEYYLLKDVGLFAKACKNAVSNLLSSLLSSNINNSPNGFVEITSETYPLIYKFYEPKFKDDRLFVKDGIVFTLVIGNKESYSKINYTTCKKFYSNDFKGKQALCDAVHSLGKCSRFAVPFSCITDYMGFRILAEPLLPLSLNTNFFVDTLLGFDSGNYNHDSHLITSTLLENDELSHDFIKLSNYLRVSSWPLPFGTSDLNVQLNFNNNCTIVDENGVLHFRNTHEVLPPYVDSKNEFDELYKYRFRPEFSTFYYKGPLKCTFKSQSLFNKDFDNSMFQLASEYTNILLDNNLDKFHTMTGSWDISNTLHSYGLNIKNLGKVYEQTSHSALKDVLASEMVARSFKHLWDLELEKFMITNDIDMDLFQSLFLKMVNDFLGLTMDSVSFWYQKLHPQISLHFDFKTLPQMLLVNALEFNMGVTIPKPEKGKNYTSHIKIEEFKSVNSPELLSFGMCNSNKAVNNFYSKVSVSYPKFNLSIFKAASKLCDHKDIYGYSFLLDSSSFGMGLFKHFKSKLLGTGYPCDPICVYNPNMLCSKFNHYITGVNLYCLCESLLQIDSLIRFKLLLTLGYSFLQHRFYKKALEIAKFLSLNSVGIPLVYVESKILELQSYCLIENSDILNNEYLNLVKTLKNLESFDGFLNIQLLMIMCYDSWNKKDYKKCISYINDSKESFLHLFAIKNYEWIPVFFLSLLGYCNKELNIYFDSTKIHHELVRYCNLSNLPTYTKCNLLWLLLESLIRVGSYSQACKVSTDLLSILEVEFGPLSMEYLRSLYVSAWINRQIGSIHFVHPYLYLSNSENLLSYTSHQNWFENQDLIMEELSSANNSMDKRKHLKDSLNLYKTLLDKFLLLSRQNKMKTLELLNTIDPDFCTKKLENLVNITYESLVKYGNENILEALDDVFMKIYLDQSNVFQSKLLLVVENFLTLKILSLDTKQCHAIANKLYNAYASQVSSDYTRLLSTGPKPETSNYSSKQTYGYGTRVLRPTETFLSHVSIKKNIIPRSGHDLRSVEQLLMGEPEYTKQNISEMCLSSCDSGNDFNIWFDSVFDFIHPKCVLSGDKFLLSLDILRNFSTPCQRLFILGHLASISRSDLNQTITFKLFKENMLNSKNKKTEFQ